MIKVGTIAAVVIAFALRSWATGVLRVPRRRAFRSWQLCWLFALVVGMAVYACAESHPVPLEKGVTDDKCLECHVDKTQGKVVHPAVQMGCQNCHFVRGAGDSTRIVLKNPNSEHLCTTCHEDKKVKAAKGPVHFPVGQDCLKCHDPHRSDNNALLKKASAGDKDANLCLECHSEGLDVPAGGSRHAALDMGCGTCHVTHKTGERGNPEFQFHLTKTAPALCLDCHDAKDAKLAQAHSGQPFAAADCTKCHDPHQSKSPKLMQANLHNPFENKMCDTCHAAPKDGKVVLTQADVKSLCVTCHEEAAKKIESAKVSHAGAQGDCTVCHNPHAGKFRRFVSPDPVTACEACHADQAELHKTKKVLHPPAYALSCSTCHAPHGNDNPKLLRASGNDLCLTCHGPDAKGLKVEGTDQVTIFGKDVMVPAIYVDRAEHINLNKAGVGHPVPYHPVGNVIDPSDPQKQNKISCERCHLPHAGDRKLLVTNSPTSAPLCAQCHTKTK